MTRLRGLLVLVVCATVPRETGSAPGEADALADLRRYWSEACVGSGHRWVEARGVAFRGLVRTPCGVAYPQTGSFYCRIDRTIYTDLEALPAGELARTYVLAHEMGHHVQGVLGVGTPSELQADCMAGMWWRSAVERQILPRSGAGTAQDAALSLAGDEAAGHGSREDRVAWFRRGLEGGTIDACGLSERASAPGARGRRRGRGRPSGRRPSGRPSVSSCARARS